MFSTLVAKSLKHRLFVLATALVLIVYGSITLPLIPVDVFPDLNRPSVTLMTEAEGLAPQEVAQLVTFPIELAMHGMPGVIRHITQIMWERMCVLFTENFPDRDPDEVLIISAAVFGANRTAAELCLRGVLKVGPEDLARSLIAWHLRALDLPEREIGRIIKLAARAYKTRRSTKKGD